MEWKTILFKCACKKMWKNKKEYNETQLDNAIKMCKKYIYKKGSEPTDDEIKNSQEFK